MSNQSEIMGKYQNKSDQNLNDDSNQINNLGSKEDVEYSYICKNTHSKFTHQDDMNLMKIVEQYGPSNWDKIASLMPGRNPRQCKERWTNYLSPDLNVSDWTVEEDLLLQQKILEMGTKWVQIAKFFPGRTDQMMKNRYYKIQREGMKMKQLKKILKSNKNIKSTPTNDRMKAKTNAKISGQNEKKALENNDLNLDGKDIDRSLNKRDLKK